jgi:thiol-disulfide isomerase/thioredoxin
MNTLKYFAIMLNAWILLAFAPGAAQNAAAQTTAKIVSCSPSAVRWGDTLTVAYNTRATKATLSVRSAVYVRLYLTMTDGASKDTTLRMTAKGTTLIAQYRLPDSVSSGFASITTAENRVDAGDEFTALRSDGIAAKGALLRALWEDSTALEKERALYPKNYAALPSKWDYQQYKKKLPEAALQAMVKDDIAALRKETPNSDDAPSYYHALATGFARVESKAELREVLRTMAQKFPLAPYTERQLMRFSVRQRNDSAIGEIRGLIRGIASRFPASGLAKSMVESNFADTTLTLSAVQPVFTAWFATTPDNPDAYSAYLSLAQRSPVLPDSAVVVAQRMLDVLMNPDSRARFGYSVSSLSEAYSQAGDIFRIAGRSGQALAAFKAAHSLTSDAEIQAELLAKEGSMWSANGAPLLAQTAFITAFANGAKSAKDSALAVYKFLNGSDAGFEALLKQRTDSIAALKKKPSLPFATKALDGKTYDLAKLKGKAVVLNFWFIGCPPCRAEIPGLNTLVQEYAKKDVVFLALALDDEKDLKEFLKKTPFTYTIAPKTREIADLYGVEAYPTHIVIDRAGMSIGQLVGGSDNRHEDLKPLIERALQKP